MKCRYLDSPGQIASAHPILVAIFNNPTLEWKDIVMLGMETFLGGIDAVSEVIFTNVLIEQVFITTLYRRTKGN
jgi:hypothetical protein